MAVGVGQVGARKVAAEPQVIEPAPLGVEAGDDIAQAFAVSQLAETKRQEVILRRKSAREARVGESFGAARKLRGIQRGGDLRKDGGRGLHPPTLGQAERLSSITVSNDIP